MKHKLRILINKPNSITSRITLDYVALIVLIVSIVVTIIMWQVYTNYVYESARTEFEQEAQRIVDKIEKRMAHYGAILYAARGLFAASNDVDRKEWKAFFDEQKIPERFPGIQGVGFQKRTSDPEVFEKDIDELRTLGLLNREPPVIDDAGYYRYIFYLEPVNERNKKAYGYDMYSEPTRREALESSRDLDAPALSGKITLVQEITEKKQAGFLLYLPVYENGKPHDTMKDRNANLIGNVYEPFRAGDFMEGIISDQYPNMEISIFDNIISDDNMLYDYDLNHGHDYNVVFTKNITIDNYGRTWIFMFKGNSELISSTEMIIGHTILITGVLFSIFLFFIVGYTRNSNKIKHKQELESKILETKHHAEIEQLENMDKQKSEFISVISHELKTPLFSIQGYAEILDMELKNIPEERKDEIREISKNSLILGTMIDDLLDTQKLDLHQIKLDKSQVAVEQLIQNVLSSLKPLFDKKSVQSKVSIPESIIVNVDTSRITQVLNNLIKNAIESINHNHGLITIMVKKESDNAVFSIKDNGIGMSNEKLGGLFKKFYQSDVTLARKKDGSGLGLYISKELVTLHGGKMWVESEEGKGTTFYFSITL